VIVCWWLHTYTRASPCLTAGLCVLCVCGSGVTYVCCVMVMSQQWYISVANVCVCLCAAPLPSDPHKCVSKVHVLGVVFMCVICVCEGVWWRGAAVTCVCVYLCTGRFIWRTTS